MSESFTLTHARLRGYLNALAKAGMKPDRDVFVYECAVNTRKQGYDATEAILSKQPEVTAILAMSDQLALGGLEAAQRLERRVPEQLAVVGFDDSELAHTHHLTSIRQPLSEKGLVAGRVLVQLLKGEIVPDVTLLPTELVIRASTLALPPH